MANKLTKQEILDYIYDKFGSVPMSETAIAERGIIILLVDEVIENRKDNGDWE